MGQPKRLRKARCKGKTVRKLCFNSLKKKKSIPSCNQDISNRLHVDVIEVLGGILKAMVMMLCVCDDEMIVK